TELSRFQESDSQRRRMQMQDTNGLAARNLARTQLPRPDTVSGVALGPIVQHIAVRRPGGIAAFRAHHDPIALGDGGPPQRRNVDPRMRASRAGGECDPPAIW